MQTTYGNRGHIQQLETGVRVVAPTFGRSRLNTFSSKSGLIVVDGQAERRVSHMLEVDPSVAKFEPQPFSVDLIDRRLLRSREQLSEARRKHAKRSGPRLYTPDFCITWVSRRKTVLEVKIEGFEGDAVYVLKLQMAQEILEAHGYEFARIVLPQGRRSHLAFNLQLLRQSRAHRAVVLESDSTPLKSLPPEGLTLGRACDAMQCSISLAPALVANGVLSMNIAEFPMHTDSPCAQAFGDLGHLCFVRGLLQ